MARSMASMIQVETGGLLMFSNPLNSRKRAASRELEVAIRYLLHDAGKLPALLKEMYKDQWSGFIDDILDGARPYEEAAAVISIFLQQSFRTQDQSKREAVTAAVAGDNLVNPPNLLRIIGQVTYYLYLAERDGQVREKLWTVWLNDMSKFLIETGELSSDQCTNYLLTLANSYRDTKLNEFAAAQAH
jgi:hypothetical protein